MNETPRPLTFMAAAKEFFGMLPGQTGLQFGQEIKKLTSADRLDLIPGLEDNLSCKIVLTPVR